MQPVMGLIASLMISSGVRAATSSISMPPAALIMITGRSEAAVRDDAQVEFLGDVVGPLHQDLVDHLAFGAGLVGDQGHAQDLVRHPLHLLGGGGGLDAAALAAAAGMDLGLDHKGAFPQFLGHLPGLPVGVGHRAFGHRHVEFPQQFFGLIFVNLHNRRSFPKRRLEKIKPEEQEKQRKIESLKKISKFMTIIIGSFLQRAPGLRSKLLLYPGPIRKPPAD